MKVVLLWLALGAGLAVLGYEHYYGLTHMKLVYSGQAKRS